LSLALVAGVLIGVTLDFPARGLALSETNQRENKIRQIINYIDFEYVEDLNTDSLLDITIADLVRKLDPHSTYIPLSQVAASEESVKGSFEGIGIEFKMFRDTLTVIRVLDDGPAQEAGLKSGDRILVAANKEMYGAEVTTEEVVGTLKGKAGSEVTLSIYRPVGKVNDIVSVKRGTIPLKSVTTSFMANPTTGYVKLDRFSQDSDIELKRAIKRLKKEGAASLIVDLRDNPGGLLSVARDVADEFLSKNKLIVFTKDRKGDETTVYASSDGEFEEGELVILINEGSASASEIVAGAVQDNDRGWVIGRRSFGKGLVQEEMTLADGSKIRLTTRRYYTPSGRSIQKPFGDYNAGFLEKSGYEGADNDLPQEEDKHVYTTKAGRKVYGGGGIMPDIEIGVDTSKSAVLLYHLSNLSNMDSRAFLYVDKHRESLEKMSKKDLVNSFEVSDTVLHFFFGGHIDRIKVSDSKLMELIKGRIRAQIAYNLYGSSGFQEAYSKYDPAIVRALQTLDKGQALLQ
jgi:carboxyl-terminal processing protease